MLVLTRKQNEKIQIGDNVTITIVRTKGKTVRVGIEAPKTMSVLRGELVFDADDASVKAGATNDSPTAPAGQRDDNWSAADSSPLPALATADADAHWSPLRAMMPSRK